MEKLLSEAIKTLAANVPLALVIIGVALFLIGATGGIHFASLEIKEQMWRVALAVLGLVIAGGGGALMTANNSTLAKVTNSNSTVVQIPTSDSVRAADFKIKIRTPLSGDQVGERFDISGSYENNPPRGYAIEILEFDESRHSYRPRRRATVNPDGTWRAVNVWGGQKSGESGLYIAALAGSAGQILADYYRKVGERLKDSDISRPSIDQMPPDVQECDRIRVTRR